nr:MAG TPA: hypothetical protein [Caudoviricetes sp.]
MRCCKQKVTSLSAACHKNKSPASPWLMQGFFHADRKRLFPQR